MTNETSCAAWPTPLRLLLIVLAFALGGCGPEAPPVTDMTLGDDFDPFVKEYCDDFVALARKKPNDAETRSRLAMAYEANRLYREATAEYDATSLLDPDNPVWPLHSVINRDRLEDADVIREAYADVCRRFPSFASAWHRYAISQLQNGDFDGARESLDKCLALEADDLNPARVTLAKLHLEMGNPNEAIPILEAVIAENPAYAQAKFVLGTARRAAGIVDEKTQSLLDENRGAPDQYVMNETEKRIGVQRADFSARVQVGNDFIARGQYTNAIGILKPCADFRPDNANVLSNLASAYSGDGQIDKALEYSDRALAIQPENHRFHSNRVQMLIRKAQELTAEGKSREADRFLDEAVASGEKAVSIDPEDWRPRTRLARAYFARGRVARAREQIEIAIGMDPQDPAPYGVKCDIARRQGDMRGARDALVKIIEIAPDDFRGRVNLVSAHISLGELEEARRQFDILERTKPQQLDTNQLGIHLREAERNARKGSNP